MRPVHTSLVAAAALAFSTVAHGAALRTADGSLLAVHAPPPAMGSSLSFSGHNQPLTFAMQRPDGTLTVGRVDGSEGVNIADVSLAQNPSTGEIVMAMARPALGGRDLATLVWTGLGWTVPAALVTSPGTDDARPSLAFRPNGDALMTWVSTDATGPRLLLRHLELAPTGEVSLHSYLDAGSVPALAAAAGAPGATVRVSRVLGGADGLSAIVLLSRDGDLPLAALVFELQAVMDTGGFGAAPVPVSFIRAASQSEAASAAARARDAGLPVARLYRPWRLNLGPGSAWYWAEEATASAQVVVLRGEAFVSVTSLLLPPDELALHLEALRIARAELGISLRAASAANSTRRTR